MCCDAAAIRLPDDWKPVLRASDDLDPVLATILVIIRARALRHLASNAAIFGNRTWA